jgi:CheY-like chemotaxis protein
VGVALRILVVDDYQALRASTASFLRRRLGAVVVEAADGAEALRAVEQGSFDAILLDLEMPRVNGMQAYERLAPELARRTLIVSGGSERPELAEWLSTHAVGRLLRKPVDFEQLAVALTALVQG